MAILNAPANGGTVYGTAGNDTINGSAFNDTLYGLSGNDTLNGLDGDDTLVGDGSVSYAAAFAAQGSIATAYTGAATTTGFVFTSMGIAGDQSIWRIRNTSTVDRVVTLQSASQGNGNNGGVSITLTIPAMSDVFIPSKNLGTHKLILDGKQFEVKAAGNQLFDTSAIVNSIEGNDILNGGNGNDTLRGNGGNDKLSGDAGNDDLEGGAGTDTIYGGDGNDTITGGEGNDAMFGGAGNDTFVVEWSVSGDKYDGGDGIDTFRADVAGLDIYAQEIDLATGTNNWQDTFANIENLVGSKVNDKFWGTDSVNEFYGRNGNDLLDGRGGNDKLYGEAGDDTLVGGAGADVLVGGDGVDTADYSASLAGVNVNLITGKGLGGDAEGDTLASIENLTGSKFADILTGDAKANVISAGAGNDVIFGSSGGDTIDGGADIDLVEYSASNAAIQVNLLAGTGLGGTAQGDKLSNIENLSGSVYDDTVTGNDSDNIISGGLGADTVYGGLGADRLFGDAGADRLEGGDGADYIEGGADNDALFGDAGDDTLLAGLGNDRLTGGKGADLINGADGVDTADYRHSDAGVDVSLVRGTGLLGDAQGDTLYFIENLSGSAFADILTGDDGANRLTGMSGEDRLFGMGDNDYIATGGGYDYVDGGDGIDTVTYEDSWDHVIVNLTTGVNKYGEASRDVLVNVENVIGSDFNDTLTGNAGANRLTGGAGNDVMNGMGGIDYLIGGAGDDSMTGGAGADVFVFNPGFGHDTITDFWAGAGRTDRIWVQGFGITSTNVPAWSAVDTIDGALITINGMDSLTLTGVKIAQLHLDDFIFS